MSDSPDPTPDTTRRTRTTGWVLVVLGVLGLIGAVGGVETSGSLHRTLVGLVSAALLVVGLLLVRPVRARIADVHADDGGVTVHLAGAAGTAGTAGGSATRRIPWSDVSTVRLNALGSPPIGYGLDLDGVGLERFSDLGRVARSHAGGAVHLVIAVPAGSGPRLSTQLRQHAGERFRDAT